MFMNSRVSVILNQIAILIYVFSLLARTLNSQGNEFPNISENKVLANISESTVTKNAITTASEPGHEKTYFCIWENQRCRSAVHFCRLIVFAA